MGVCLGCVGGISLTIVAAKWLHGRVADLNYWHEVIYYAVFFASIAWAFAWGAARSAVHLLWLCAAAPIGVDVVAFIGALCFAWMAIATKRRIKRDYPGELDVPTAPESGLVDGLHE